MPDVIRFLALDTGNVRLTQGLEGENKAHGFQVQMHPKTEPILLRREENSNN